MNALDFEAEVSDAREARRVARGGLVLAQLEAEEEAEALAESLHNALMRAPAAAFEAMGVTVIDMDVETPESAAAKMIRAPQRRVRRG